MKRTMTRPKKKKCNVFFERFPQFASVFATEMTDVSLSRHSRTRSQYTSVLRRQGCVDLLLPSSAIAVHSVPTTASANADSVVNGFVLFIGAGHKNICKDGINTVGRMTNGRNIGKQQMICAQEIVGQASGN